MQFENLTIKGLRHEHKFGIGFLRALDTLYKLESEGAQMPLGFGLEFAMFELQTNSPTALSNVLWASLSRNTRKSITLDDVDEALESFIDDGNDYKEVIAGVLSELKNSSALRELLAQG